MKRIPRSSGIVSRGSSSKTKSSSKPIPNGPMASPIPGEIMPVSLAALIGPTAKRRLPPSRRYVRSRASSSFAKGARGAATIATAQPLKGSCAFGSVVSTLTVSKLSFSRTSLRWPSPSSLPSAMESSPWPTVKHARTFSPPSTLRIAPVMACSSRGFARESEAPISNMSPGARNQCLSPRATTMTASVTTRPSAVRPVSIRNRFRTSSRARESLSGSM